MVSSSKNLEHRTKQLLRLLESSIQNNVPKRQFALLFSGGLDSALLALLCKNLGLDFTCFFGYIETGSKPKDLEFAEKAAKALNLKLETFSVPREQCQDLVSEAVSLIGLASPVQVGVALPLLLACKKAKQLGFKLVFSGMGADELFCGYAKFRNSKDIALLSWELVQALPKEDLKRDLAIASSQGLVLRTPFLNAGITKFALALPPKRKLSAKANKLILRELALALGLPKELAQRKKLAAQYGSNSDKAIEWLAKRDGAKKKSAYLEAIAKQAGLPKPSPEKKPLLAALFSGGKDSCLALWLMQKQGFGVECLVSMIPKNPDSFMYHKPDPKILGLQSKALGIPLLLEKTSGQKEKELSSLKTALQTAKKRFGIGAVVSGALYSNYQRKRIQKICDSLGLELFSPLWHMGQAQELKLLANSGFLFIMSKVAGLGLNEKWLGMPVGAAEIKELELLEKKTGFNIAGEGGEFESIVLDAPNFSRKLKIVKSEKIMENEFTGRLEIQEAVLA